MMIKYATIDHNDDPARTAADVPLSVSPSDLARMETALLSLPRLTREIFLAVRLDDLGYREIAQRTGLSVRSVERHVARTIVALNRALPAEGDESA